MMKQALLPAETNAAIQKMTDITRDMKNIAQREADALAEGNGDALKRTIDQKADLVFMYEDAGKEFHQRLEEFRSAPPHLVDELVREQQALKSLETANRAFYERAQGKGL